jgi:hypothetical protein
MTPRPLMFLDDLIYVPAAPDCFIKFSRNLKSLCFRQTGNEAAFAMPVHVNTPPLGAIGLADS